MEESTQSNQRVRATVRIEGENGFLAYLASTPVVPLVAFGVVWIVLIEIAFSAASVFLAQSYAAREYYGSIATTFLITLNLLGMFFFYMLTVCLYRMASLLVELLPVILLQARRRRTAPERDTEDTQEPVEEDTEERRYLEDCRRLGRLSLRSFFFICSLYFTLIMSPFIINVFNIFVRF